MAVHGENATKLQALTDKHKQVASLLAQGLGRSEIAKIVDFVPEYVTWLARDPLFKEYLAGLSAYAEAQHEAIFSMTPAVVSEAMRNGSCDERLRAVRLNLEVTGRIGKGERSSGAIEGSFERLATLAERLLKLQSNVREGVTINGSASIIEANSEGSGVAKHNSPRGLSAPTGPERTAASGD